MSLIIRRMVLITALQLLYAPVYAAESGQASTAEEAKSAGAQPREIPLIEVQNESQSAQDVSYVTGGIGEEEKEMIEAARDDYNLHIVNTDSSGAYIGDVRVVISLSDGTGITEKLNVVAGPLLYANLPAAHNYRYTVKATLGSQQQSKALILSRKGGKAASVIFVWKTQR